MKLYSGILSLTAFAAANVFAVEISSSSLSVTLDESRKGVISGIKVIPSGALSKNADFSAPKTGVPLFSLTLSKDGEVPGNKGPGYINASNAQSFTSRPHFTNGTGSVVLRYEKFPNGNVESVECTASVRAGDPLIRWGVTVCLKSGWNMESMSYPAFPLALAPDGDTTNAAFVSGWTKGGIIHNPGARKGFSTVWQQPGSLAAAFACYYENNSGFYTAAEDSGLNPKRLRVQQGKEELTVQWERPCFDSGCVTQQYEIVTGGFTGAPADWRDAADIYKSWALKQKWCAKKLTERDDLPSWLKDAPAFLRFNGRQWFANPERSERWIKGYWQKYFSKMPMIAAMWGWEKHGDWVTPDYFPLVPDNETFAKLVSFLRANDCHAFPWPSGYRWTLSNNRKTDGSVQWEDLTKFSKVGASHATYKRDGNLLLEQPGWLQGGTCTWLCGGDIWTRDFWNNEVCAPLCKLGCEMIQADQTVGGNFPDCYKNNHGHPLGCGAWKGKAFEEQLVTMAATMKKIQPDSVVCFEEPNEWYNHLVGIQDYRDTESPYEWASVYGYLYHEFVPPFQSNPTRGGRIMEAYCLADGQMPFITPWINDLNDEIMANKGMEASGSQQCAYAGWEKLSGYQGEIWSGRAETDFQIKHSGISSLRLNNATGDIVQVSQNFPASFFTTNGRYRISAWLKTGEGGNQNNISFCFFNESDGIIHSAKGSDSLAFPKPGTDWTHVFSDFSVPQGAITMRLMINGRGKTLAWVDDFQIEAVSADGAVAELKKDRNDSYLKFMRRWTDLYHSEGRAWLAHGMQIHPPKLVCAKMNYEKTRHGKTSERSVPVLFHNAFRAADGKEAVIIANATHKRQTGTLTWHGKTSTVTVEADDAIVVK